MITSDWWLRKIPTFYKQQRWVVPYSKSLLRGKNDQVRPKWFKTVLSESITITEKVVMKNLKMSQLFFAKKRCQVSFSFDLVQLISFGLAKLSVLFFYRRIFRGKVFEIMSWTMIGIMGIWIISFFFAVLFRCGTNYQADEPTRNALLDYYDNLIKSIQAITISYTSQIIHFSYYHSIGFVLYPCISLISLTHSLDLATADVSIAQGSNLWDSSSRRCISLKNTILDVSLLNITSPARLLLELHDQLYTFCNLQVMSFENN